MSTQKCWLPIDFRDQIELWSNGEGPSTLKLADFSAGFSRASKGYGHRIAEVVLTSGKNSGRSTIHPCNLHCMLLDPWFLIWHKASRSVLEQWLRLDTWFTYG